MNRTLNLVFAVVVALWCREARAKATFTPLGDLPGGAVRSGAYGASPDGSVVVEFSSSSQGSQAFRWTLAEGMVGLGDLPGGTSIALRVPSPTTAPSLGAASALGWVWVDLAGTY
jgi:probable HAF family extracellular repeat protein